MAPDVDELFENLQELDPEEWEELTRKLQAHRSREFRDAQRAYFDRLEEEGLLGQRGRGGGTFQPIPGQEEEWIEYCREHPNDPICLAGVPPAVGDRLTDFLEIREEYLSHLEEEGLVDIEELSSGGDPNPEPMASVRGNPSPQPNLGGSGSPVGLTPPWPWPPGPWPPEWPPWPWPWPGPRPDPAPFSGGQRPDITTPQMVAGQGQRGAFDPRVGYTPRPDGPVWPPWPPRPWPPEWPPWPCPPWPPAGPPPGPPGHF